MLAKYFFVAVAAIVGGVMGAYKCDSQLQFDLCKQDMQKYVDGCPLNNPQCLCRTNKVILNNCYALCPQDPGLGSQQSIVSSWCVSAGGDKEESPSSVPVATPTTTGATSTGTDTTAPSNTETSTTTDTSRDNETETSTTSRSQSTGNAGSMLAPAGFMVAAAAVAGLVL
ncbi:hypothetical protein EV426DRAFT_618433 [Tirmania nivea]|nr:hypothetical protein EV426DRAFT_618433 [Tirmania nivea]